ncbi:MAG: hypothetical protein GY911_10825 [Actinomycetales bacterium]|nr:hypothetical protein [Actinomycetales bacterium]
MSAIVTAAAVAVAAAGAVLRCAAGRLEALPVFGGVGLAVAVGVLAAPAERVEHVAAAGLVACLHQVLQSASARCLP